MIRLREEELRLLVQKACANVLNSEVETIGEFIDLARDQLNRALDLIEEPTDAQP